MKSNHKILITGATGFLGSNLCKAFAAHGFEVFGLIRKTSSLSRLGEILSNSNFKLVETKDLESISPEIIIHTATAYGRLGENKEQVGEVNLSLPIQLLQKKGVKYFLNCDTFIEDNLPENDRYYLYAKSKKDFLKSGHILAKEKGLKFVNLRIYQMFGPDDNPTKFLPFIINKIILGEQKLALTKGEQRRDFVYITDVVSAFLRAVENLEIFGEFEHFEIGAGKSYSIREVVEYLKKYSKSEINLGFGELPYSENELMNSAANTSVNKKLGWSASADIYKSLEKTFQYYLNL